MISIIKNRTEIGIKDYVCDEATELSDIDIRTTRMGSTCFVINEKTTYILNGQKKWVSISGAGETEPEIETEENPEG